MTDQQLVLGIDIGGSGVKGAVVNVSTGAKASDRFRIDTPDTPTTEALSATVDEIVDHFSWDGPVGCTFPGVVRNNIVHTAVNIHPSWVGVNAAEVIGTATEAPVTMLNDADSAGLAELRFGAAQTAGHADRGTVLVITLGTGVGSALFHDGVLVPNTEFGHVEINGADAELTTSARYKDANRLGWEQWAPNVETYLRHIEFLLWPDLIILGGGISKSFDAFAPLIDIRTPLVGAELRNDAGIVGAAVHATAMVS